MSSDKAVNRKMLRHSWSHTMWAHRFAVKCYNRILSLVPFQIKYSIGKSLRKNEFPYQLLDSESVVVQVGAPADTLKAGRSRAMYFSLFTAGGSGKTVIVEPDEASESRFAKIAKSQKLDHIVYCRSGAWSEKKLLKLYVDPQHPATNFIEGTVDYTPERVSEFDAFEVPVDTVDNILASNGIEHVDLISVTTNGSEEEILRGMQRTMASGVQYICLARTSPDFNEMMSNYGYELLAYDDRGFTFQRTQVQSKAAA